MPVGPFMGICHSESRSVALIGPWAGRITSPSCLPPAAIERLKVHAIQLQTPLCSSKGKPGERVATPYLCTSMIN